MGDAPRTALCGVEITPVLISAVMPYARLRAQTYAPHFNTHCQNYEINTPMRLAAFLAQIALESGELKYTRELGSNAYLDRYDTGRLAKRLGNTPDDDDDGQLYRGRGLIQITGRANYWSATNALGVDLITNPELLETPDLATRSACWFWQSHHLNELADAGEFEKTTRIINGGLNHYAERQRYYRRAKQALNIKL